MAAARPADAQPCDIDELRTLFLFEHLDDDQLRWLCAHGHVERREPGVLYAEGEPAAWFYVLLEGSVALDHRVGTDDVEISRTSQRGVYGGAWAAYLGERAPQTYSQTMRVLAPSRFYALPAADFSELMTQWFPMAVHLLEGLFMGQRDTQLAVNQRERLLALGALSAGLTHELNNPAAAAGRATSALRERVAGMRHKLALIASGPYDATTLATLVDLQEQAVESLAKSRAPGAPPPPTALERTDAEDAVTDWLDAHSVREPWDLAPTFVSARLDGTWLDAVADAVAPEVLEGAVRWLGYALETEQLMNEVEDATTRISTLVGAAKQYSQIGLAPDRELDVHELLDATLTMLDKRLEGVTVVRAYDRTLPPVHAYGAALNQVWTNLLDNAAQALDGAGTLTVTTRRVDDWLEVEVADTGPGIPPDVVGRVFEPFFTTKPVGSGTGLGLDIAWRIVVGKHHGDLTVRSQPGDTRFLVRLPYTAEVRPS
ncbi:histidine kinase [Cellulomonas shaoxiangyii]|uniref:histidine kinase n=1 Tax=Cellulomonas shaoxiangyii TaxID=2566013 RepID=A0A4P7SP73_9CELL|nr:histidine kinase [Cellulomonas shaoxiangyii]TGY86427.1 histidine kinase [Cellulomonas shaoxiangyii]